MKKVIIVLLICFVNSIPFAYAQVNTVNNVLENNKFLPKERVFAHVNASLFLAGENLFYKLYCLNKETNTLSTLSKVAYVELISENKNVVFKHKIILENGVGYGDFIFPVSVSSGNYKLIAYTQWMKNEGIRSFFKSDISIINPFQSNQETILVDDDTNVANNHEVLQSFNSELSQPINSQFFEIILNKKVFLKRDKVLLTLKNKDNNNITGNYSISVRKVDGLDMLASKKVSSTVFLNQRETNEQVIKKIDYLPELRGELISGKLLRNVDNNPASNEKVALSIQQNDFILKISKTNQVGIFYFNIEENYDKETAILQVLGKDNKDFKIVLDEHNSLDYNQLDFGVFKISSKYKNILEKRSIYNQIENGYFDLKPNKLEKIDSIQPFFGAYYATYYLDDYNRFAKIQETFIEVIKDAYIKRDNNQKINFFVASLDPYEQLEKPAGVIVDGILLQDFKQLINYDSRKIKRISIARTETNFILGSNTFGGLIIIQTIDGKFYDELEKNNLKTVNLFKPEPKKKYFKKKYTSHNTLNRIPDYRNQLYWEPSLNLNNDERTFEFFTSDNIGEYEISIEGFTEKGNPISLKDFIRVK